MISQSEQAVDTLGAADPATTRIAALEAENDKLKAQLAWFKRQIFGRKSEKQILLNADQQSLFAAEAPAQAD
ncbi:MAG: transposase, partial [Gammaproteobacteria bacterium]